MRYAFGEFELDLATCELRRNGARVVLQPRVFDTLQFLIERRHRVVHKDELIEALWAGQQLNEAAVAWSISHARKALGQSARAESPIQTVRGRGYRFLARVRVAQDPSDESQPMAADADPQRVASAADPFVGRAELLEELIAGSRRAWSGEGCIDLLTGEAGIGKSRCIAELESVAQRHPCAMWIGRCAELTGTPVLWPFIQVLRDCSEDRSLDARDRAAADALRAKIAPRKDEHESASGPTPSKPGFGAEARFWLIDDLCTFLIRLAHAAPRLLVLEDMHAADDASIEALTLLATKVQRSRLFVVATARDGTSAEAERCADLAGRLRPRKRIALRGLSVDAITDYLDAVTGRVPDARLVVAIEEATAGNPLFLREVVRTLRTERGGFRLHPSEVRLPRAAKDLMRARIAALAPVTRNLLKVASVLGEEFDLGVLWRATGSSPDELLEQLDAGIEAGWVEACDAPQRLRFAHGMLRTALYDSLSAMERARLHSLVALALESQAVVEPRHAELAYHFYHGLPHVDPQRTVRHAELAGNSAMQICAYDDAAKHYGWALTAQSFVPQPCHATACRLLLSSASALLGATRFREYRDQCRRAIAIAREENLPAALAEAGCLLRPALSFVRVRDRFAAETLRAARDALPESATALRARVCSRLACTPPHSHSIAVSDSLSADAVQLARQTGDSWVLMEALRSRFHALSGPDVIDELLATTDELLHLGRGQRSWLNAEAHLARYHARLLRGDVAAANTCLRAYGEAARELRLASITWDYERVRAQRRLEAGELDRAEQAFERLRAEAEALQLPYGPQLHDVQRSMLNFARTGRLALQFGGPSDPGFAETNAAARAEAIHELLRTEARQRATRELHGAASDRFAAVEHDSRYLYTLCRFAQAAAALGERDIAAVLHSLLAPYAAFIALNDFSFSLGSVSYFLGLTSWVLGCTERAEAELLAALHENERAGFHLHVLCTQRALCELLAELPCPRSQRRAAELSRDLCQAAARLGITAPPLHHRPFLPGARQTSGV